MVKFTKVLKEEIIQRRQTSAGTMILLRVTCEDADGRKAVGLTWMSKHMYTDSRLNIDNILLDFVETAMIAREEEE